MSVIQTLKHIEKIWNCLCQLLSCSAIFKLHFIPSPVCLTLRVKINDIRINLLNICVVINLFYCWELLIKNVLRLVTCCTENLCRQMLWQPFVEIEYPSLLLSVKVFELHCLVHVLVSMYTLVLQTFIIFDCGDKLWEGCTVVRQFISPIFHWLN